jgi:hypothetical protein
MKKSIKKVAFLLGFFALLLCVSNTFAHDKKGPGKTAKKEATKEEKTNAVKKDSKRATVYFIYIGGPVGSASSWVKVGGIPVPTPCNGGDFACGMQFDDGQYPLEGTDEDPKPNDEVLGIFANNWVATSHNSEIGTTGVFVFKRSTQP